MGLAFSTMRFSSLKFESMFPEKLREMDTSDKKMANVRHSIYLDQRSQLGGY